MHSGRLAEPDETADVGNLPMFLRSVAGAAVELNSAKALY